MTQKKQVGPCILVGTQLENPEVSPTSGPPWHLSHLIGRVTRVVRVVMSVGRWPMVVAAATRWRGRTRILGGGIVCSLVGEGWLRTCNLQGLTQNLGQLKARIGIFSQTAGSTCEFWANPVDFTLRLRLGRRGGRPRVVELEVVVPRRGR